MRKIFLFAILLIFIVLPYYYYSTAQVEKYNNYTKKLYNFIDITIDKTIEISNDFIEYIKTLK